MKFSVVDIKNKKIEDLELSDKVFKVDVNPSLMAQYVRVFRMNQRQGTASTKTRAEVSGGGRKPWRQKGTGRARHGSTRSPIWVHGGVAFGPKPKSWNLNFPKKMKQKAILGALSDKAKAKNIMILEKVELKEPSTKEAVELAKNLKLEGKTLFVVDKANQNFIKSATNAKGLKTALWENLNAYEIIENKNLVLTKDAALNLQKKYETK